MPRTIPATINAETALGHIRTLFETAELDPEDDMKALKRHSK
jgi:hypothetical protein